MRKDVPKLNDQVTKKDLLDVIVESFQTVIFATVDDEGRPRSNAADIELRKDNKLIFSTIKGGNFYKRLKNHPFISITALKGDETMNSVAITVNGRVEELDSNYLDKIYAARPEMTAISEADAASQRENLRPFAIIPIDGSVYDLRQNPVFQKHFEF